MLIFSISLAASGEASQFQIRASFASQKSGAPNTLYWQAPKPFKNCQIDSEIFTSPVENVGHIQLFARETTEFIFTCQKSDFNLDATQSFTIEISRPTGFWDGIWDETWDWGHHANHLAFESILHPILGPVIGFVVGKLPLVSGIYKFFAELTAVGNAGHGHSHGHGRAHAKQS